MSAVTGDDPIRPGQQPPQVDDRSQVDVLVPRRLEHLGRSADADFELAVVVLPHRPHCLEQRPHLAPRDVRARRMSEDPLERFAMIGVQPGGTGSRMKRVEAAWIASRSTSLSSQLPRSMDANDRAHSHASYPGPFRSSVESTKGSGPFRVPLRYIADAQVDR
jgi:hypothetical protein